MIESRASKKMKNNNDKSNVDNSNNINSFGLV